MNIEKKQYLKKIIFLLFSLVFFLNNQASGSSSNDNPGGYTSVLRSKKKSSDDFEDHNFSGYFSETFKPFRKRASGNQNSLLIEKLTYASKALKIIFNRLLHIEHQENFRIVVWFLLVKITDKIT